MPLQGEYMGMMLTVDDVDRENREFFAWCDKGEFRLQRSPESGLLRYPPTTACPWSTDRDYEWVPVEGRGAVHSYVEVHQCAVERRHLPAGANPARQTVVPAGSNRSG